MNEIKKMVEEANNLEIQRYNLEQEIRNRYFEPIIQMDDSQEKMDKAVELVQYLGNGVSYLRFQCFDLMTELEDNGYDKSAYILKKLNEQC